MPHRRPSLCDVPGAFSWNGYPEARRISGTIGSSSCCRGGNQPCSNTLEALLCSSCGPISLTQNQISGILPHCCQIISSRPSPISLLRPVHSPQVIIARRVVTSMCSAFFDIVFVRAQRASQGSTQTGKLAGQSMYRTLYGIGRQALLELSLMTSGQTLRPYNQ